MASGRGLVAAAAIMVIGVLGACGGGNQAADAPVGGDDAPVIDGAIDAPVPPPDGLTATCQPVSGTTVAFQLVDVAPDAAVLVTSPRDQPRKFVVLRPGLIHVLDDTDHVVPAPFLDIRRISGGPVTAGGERGLLGLAFHPQFSTNGRFYVYYTAVDAASAMYDVVAEYRVTGADPDVADPTSARVILSIPDYAVNHNAGMMEFGTDGLLYIGIGDGGGDGDPQLTAQDKNRLLGKMLRLDVDNPSGGREYGIPPGNPYAAGGGAGEVLMYGLRNPWRWSFDPATGDIYVGDVGHHCVEEIDVIPAAQIVAADLGWSDCEGSLDKYGTSCNAPTEPNRIQPVYEEVRDPPAFPMDCNGPSLWRAVIGGSVYRGTCFPDLVGRYFYTDHFAAALYSFVYAGGQATDVVLHPGTFPTGTTSIHADSVGELYVTNIDGSIYRIVAQ